MCRRGRGGAGQDVGASWRRGPAREERPETYACPRATGRIGAGNVARKVRLGKGLAHLGTCRFGVRERRTADTLA